MVIVYRKTLIHILRSVSASKVSNRLQFLKCVTREKDKERERERHTLENNNDGVWHGENVVTNHIGDKNRPNTANHL